MRSDRSVSAVLDDATGRLGTAGREGILTSNEQDVRKHRAAPSTGHCAVPHMDGWAVLRFGVEIIIRSESENLVVIRISRQNFVYCNSG